MSMLQAIRCNRALVVSGVLAACTCIAVYVVVGVLNAQVAASQSRSEMLYSATVANLQAARNEAASERYRGIAVAYLRRVARGATDAEAMAFLLDDLQSSARESDVSIAGLQRTQPAQPATLASTAPAMSAQPVVIQLRGSFAPLLRFVRTFSARGTLVRVDGMDLSSAAASHTSIPILTATLRAELYRLPIAAQREVR